jgi:hypothetical protein
METTIKELKAILQLINEPGMTLGMLDTIVQIRISFCKDVQRVNEQFRIEVDNCTNIAELSKKTKIQQLINQYKDE